MLAIAVVFASCAQPQKAAAAATKVAAAASGSAFDQVGKVTLYAGQPCTSQIMFVFRAGRSPSIELAAPFRETRMLTDATHRHRTVHVWGKWRRAKQTGCSYVEVTQVEIPKSFWEKFR